MRTTFLIICLLAFSLAAYTQQPVARDTTTGTDIVRSGRNTTRVNPYLLDTLLKQIPISRALFHDKISNEQNRADAADGKVDGSVFVPGNVQATKLLSRALIREVKEMQTMVENMPPNGRDSVVSNQQKIQSLRAIWEMLRQYNGDPRPDAGYYVQLVQNMHDMIVAANEHKSLDFVMANPCLATLDNSRVLLDNQPESRTFIYKWMGQRDPVLMLKRLEEFSKDTFATDIISAAARKEPKLIFNYALSSNVLLKKAIYRTKDPFVQAIVQITAESAAPLRALPFVADLMNGVKTIDDIDTIASDPVRSFNELVRLRTSNEPLSRSLYTDEIEYSALKNFVRQMNELHDTTDDVRFRCVDSLSPEALYYIMVYGREEIYTSSFLGTFHRFLERMKPEPANRVLDRLHRDQFRTFIRLCAGYNTLSEFLMAMEDSSRIALMNDFVGGLQNGADNELEDAVNVADALGSIRDSSLFVYLQQKVRENYDRCVRMESRKGIAIYKLLGLLIDAGQSSVSDTGVARTSARLKLPPVNVLPAALLANDTGAILERLFFYGDQDGVDAYRGFIDEYRKNPKWKVDTSARYWATVSSLVGKRIIMYANYPLKEPEDDVAIDSLDAFLRSVYVRPTVVIHRGHSYHVKGTISRIDTNARLVMLGSCGGYHNVSGVLARSQGAHIISSKQTGVGAINEPIIRAINTQLQEGSDVNWIAVWKGLDDGFSKRRELYEKFTDYIPPHKNLGVIFIKAYSAMMQRK
ncbi:MAG: hypothetical protein IAE95_15070 [Chitinophagaceae bacterium]|nr:hypothetical protein [Chitinophagaceae bacterium]